MNISKQVIGCAFEVHRVLGNGFLESVYEQALAVELRIQGVEYERQVPIPVTYKKHPAGVFVADLVVEQQLILELKAIKTLTRICESQLINYLNASGLSVGLLLNFGAQSLQIKRMVNHHDEQTVI